jgi:hypothetical protein
MMRLRSASLKLDQSAISSRVRPQPEQRPETGSNTQIFMQGLSIFRPYLADLFEAAAWP